MEAKDLMQNLIDAIEAIKPDTIDAKGLIQLEDAQETAQLARLVLPTIAAPAPPQAGRDHIVFNDDHDTYYGPMTQADAQALEQATIAAGEAATLILLHDAASWGGVGPASAAINAGQCPACGAVFVNGNCPDPNCTVHKAVTRGATMVQFPAGPQPNTPGGAPVGNGPAATCPACGDPLNANGECDNCGWQPGSGVATPTKSQTFSEVMDDVHRAAQRARPGSVISNKPPGSLYN